MPYPELERFVMKQWQRSVRETNTQHSKDKLAINYEANHQEHPWTIGTLLKKYQQAELDCKVKITQQLAYFWRDALIVRHGAVAPLDVPMVMQHVGQAAAGGLGSVNHAAEIFLQRRGSGLEPGIVESLLKQSKEAAEKRMAGVLSDLKQQLEIEVHWGQLKQAREAEEVKKNPTPQIIERLIVPKKFVEPTTLRVSSTTILRWIRDNTGEDFAPTMLVLPYDWAVNMVWAQLDTLSREGLIHCQPIKRVDGGIRSYNLSAHGSYYLQALENIELASGKYLWEAVKYRDYPSPEAQLIWETTPFLQKMRGRLAELKAQRKRVIFWGLVGLLPAAHILAGIVLHDQLVSLVIVEAVITMVWAFVAELRKWAYPSKK
jgi:hypothetical protein